MTSKYTNSIQPSPDDLRKTSSAYLAGGKKQEEWIIEDLFIDGETLKAIINMKSFYQPQPENIAFHLSFITALEFTSQLAIVYLHHWAQLKDKTNEVWLVKSICEVGSPITNPDCIEVYMQVKSIRKFQGKVYANQEFFITDHNQGQMRIELTGLMEL